MADFTPPDDAGAWEAAVFALHDEAVLVAPDLAEQPEPLRSGVLWKVSCALERVEVLVARQGADFGSAALDLVDNTFVFTDGDGIATLDLRSRSIHTLVKNPEGLELVVGSWESEGELEVYLGKWVPGGHLNWKGATYRFRPSKPGSLPCRTTPVTAVAGGGSDTIWVATGGRCSNIGINDLYDPSAVWRGNPREGFERVEIPGLQYGVAKLWQDPARPERVLVRSGDCTDEVEECLGCQLFATRDAGQSWNEWALPTSPVLFLEVAVDQALQDATVRLRGYEHPSDTFWQRRPKGKPSWRRIPPPESFQPTSALQSLPSGLRATDMGLIDSSGETAFRYQGPERSVYGLPELPQCLPRFGNSAEPGGDGG